MIKSLILASLISVYDGDTFRGHIDNVHPLIGDNVSIRVAGVDTPELRGSCDAEIALAREARTFTTKALRGADVIELRYVKRGRYFRIVADVYYDGNSLTSGLINAGLGVPYYGGTKTKEWCE